jgi:hypothetical protein
MVAYFFTDRVLGIGGGHFARFDLRTSIDGSNNSFVTSENFCRPQITLSGLIGVENLRASKLMLPASVP